MRMAPGLPMAVAMLMAVAPMEVTVADAGAVADHRTMVMMVVMSPWGVPLVAVMMAVTMAMMPLGERGGGRRDEQSGRA